MIGEPDVYNKRLKRHLPDGRAARISEYRVVPSEQTFLSKKEIYVLQGGEFGPPRTKRDEEFFYVKVHIPYRSEQEALDAKRKLDVKEKSVSAAMEVLLNARDFNCKVCGE